MKAFLVILLVPVFNIKAQAQSNGKGNQRKFEARVSLLDGKVRSGRVVQYTKDSLYLDSIANAIHYSRIKKLMLMRANKFNVFRKISPLSRTKIFLVKGDALQYEKAINSMKQPVKNSILKSDSMRKLKRSRGVKEKKSANDKSQHAGSRW